MKIAGSFQIDAMFIDSWKPPMFVEPSPKKTSETPSEPLYCSA